MAVKQLLTEKPAQPEKQARGVGKCSAHNCPLPATITLDSGGAVCACHFGAKAEGWPKATDVILRLETLWRLAREAQCSGAPESVSADLARDLFLAARAEGLKSSDEQKEMYRRAGEDGRDFMRLRMAGAMVEACIRAEVHAAAMSVGEVIPMGQVRESGLSIAIRGLAMHLQEAAGVGE